MDSFDYIFIGSKLTNIVALNQVLKNNPRKKVALIAPEEGIGGHFSSRKIDGITFDPGTVMHEFTSFGEKANALLAAFTAS